MKQSVLNSSTLPLAQRFQLVLVGVPCIGAVPEIEDFDRTLKDDRAWSKATCEIFEPCSENRE